MNITKEQIEVIENNVFHQLGKDKSGHGFDHIGRVVKLAKRLCEYSDEDIDENLVIAAALLHDVDDYKVVDEGHSGGFENAEKILDEARVLDFDKNRIIEIIENMGYSKSLKGIRPKTLEGKIVSDADLCDAIGANGILRCMMYVIDKAKKSGKSLALDEEDSAIFDQSVFPNVDISFDEYFTKDGLYKTDNFINHFFEKLLNIEKIVQTSAGKKEAAKRTNVMYDFLEGFFEENNLQDWIELLDKFKINRLK